MKLFVLGKRGSIVSWAEDCVAGFRYAGHEVRFGITRDPRLSRAIDGLLLAPWAGLPRAVWIGRAITRFSPDFIIAVGPYHMPLAILEHVARLPGRPPILGWVGDLFSNAARPATMFLDVVSYTDTALVKLHRDLGFPGVPRYLPHAASSQFSPGSGGSVRRNQMVFVANPTEQRCALIDQVHRPLRLFGPGWTRSAQGVHEVHPRRVARSELARLYGTHLSVLNIRNENNVLAGLNQRHFDPYIAATPVISDDQADIEYCFDLHTEMLVYRDVEELNDIYARLQREPQRAAAIGIKGRQRVLQKHGYAQRLAVLTGVN